MTLGYDADAVRFYTIANLSLLDDYSKPLV
jgi:hypothetical protein